MDFIFSCKWQLGSMIGIDSKVCLYGSLGREAVRVGTRELVFSSFG